MKIFSRIRGEEEFEETPQDPGIKPGGIRERASALVHKETADVEAPAGKV